MEYFEKSKESNNKDKKENPLNQNKLLEKKYILIKNNLEIEKKQIKKQIEKKLERELDKISRKTDKLDRTLEKLDIGLINLKI